MFEKYLLKTIHFDEAIVRVVRSSWMHYRWPIFIWTMLLIISCFLIYPLLTLGLAGVVVLTLLIGAALLGLIRIGIIWSLNVFIITNRRIIDIDQKKVFEKHVAECPLENIQDIIYNKKGVLSTLFNVGTVVIHTGGGKGRIEFVDISKPEVIKELVMNVQHRHGKDSERKQEI